MGLWHNANYFQDVIDCAVRGEPEDGKMLGRELRAGEREIRRWDGVRLLEKEEGLEREESRGTAGTWSVYQLLFPKVSNMELEETQV